MGCPSPCLGGPLGGRETKAGILNLPHWGVCLKGLSRAQGQTPVYLLSPKLLPIGVSEGGKCVCVCVCARLGRQVALGVGEGGKVEIRPAPAW